VLPTPETGTPEARQGRITRLIRRLWNDRERTTG